jgi:glycosyltransferase 2 family protein
MKAGILRWVRYAVTVAIIVGLVMFARTVNWHDTWQAIRHSNMWLLFLAAAVNLLSLAVKGVRWWVFLRPIGASSLGLAMRATFAGAGLNNVLVANGGEAARVIFVSRATHLPSAKVLATLLIERLFEAVGYVVMLTMAVSFLSLPPSISRMRPVAWAAFVGVIALFTWLIRRPRSVEEALAPATHWWAKTKQYGARLLQTLGSVSTGPRFAGAMTLSVLVWALQVATYHLTAMAAGFKLPLVGTVACLIAVNIGFAIRATPGNVGLFQVMYAVTAEFFGMDKNQAIAVAFLIQTQQILPVTALGIAMAPEFIFGNRRPLGEDRADLQGPAVES